MPLPGGPPVKVEILKRIYGLLTEDVQESAIEMQIHGIPVRVPSPLILLRAKLENAVHLEQDKKGFERQDVKHLKMALIVTGVVLKETVHAVHAGKIKARDCLDAFEDFIRAVTSRTAKRATEMYGIHWTEGLPLDELAKSKNPKLRNFFEKRLSRCFPEIQKPRTPRSPA